MSKPLLNALLMADGIVTEDNGKKVLVGIFSRFNFPQFPAQAPPWFLYAGVENLEGHNTFTFNLGREDTQEVAFSAGGEVEIQDPTSGVEIVLQVPPIVFRVHANYILQFLVNGHELISRKLPVTRWGRDKNGGIDMSYAAIPSMTGDATIQSAIEPNRTFFFSALGESATGARSNRILLPNAQTRQIMAETDAGANVVNCSSIDDLFNQLDA